MEKQIINQPVSYELNFKPITEGLGFHPFSDGLPYAPVTKSPRIAGPSAPAGATAAGPPKIVLPRTPTGPAPQVSVPVAKKEQPSTLQNTVQTQEPSFNYTYLLRRGIAYLLDTSFNVLLCASILIGLMWIQDLSWDVLTFPSVGIVLVLFTIGFHGMLMMIQELCFKNSLGKRIVRLRLCGSVPAIFCRNLFFIPSFLTGVGLLWSLFDPQKRCWHDLIVGVQPIDMTRL